MVYLIGVYHESQYTNDKTKPADFQIVTKFTNYLENEVRSRNVTLIAEESNDEIMRMNEAKTRTVCDVAVKVCGIKHIYCDPDRSEKKSLGILCYDQIKEKIGLKGLVIRPQDKERIKEEKRKYHPIKEQRWFECIKDKLHEPIIFVCGDGHVKNFCSLLTEHGYEATILKTGWGKEIQENQICRALE